MSNKHTPIPGWPGYEASEDGHIYSTESDWRGMGTFQMTPTLNGRGYLKVRLTAAGTRRRSVALHKLIALTFLGQRPTLDHEVCHINGDPHDNRAVNLRWGHSAGQCQ